MTIEQDNIQFSKLKTEITRSATLKECILKDFTNNCSMRIVNAHSLQRMGSLSILESNVNGNQSVYALTESMINPRTGLLELKPIGKKNASTFFGFCKTHDSEIFKPIEENTELINLESDEHCFLLSFRAFAISYHRKKEGVNLFSTKDQLIRDKVKGYFNTNDIESMLKGSRLGLQDLESVKQTLISALLSKDYSCLEILTYELNHTAPIAMSMSTSPPYFFNGLPMNISIDPGFKYSDIMTSVIPLENRMLIVLSSLKTDPLGTGYLDELDHMNDVSLEKALTWHILTNAENCFFSPMWYLNLNPIQKNFLFQLSEFSANVNTPYLKYCPRKFNFNLFDKRYKIIKTTA